MRSWCCGRRKYIASRAVKNVNLCHMAHRAYTVPGFLSSIVRIRCPHPLPRKQVWIPLRIKSGGRGGTRFQGRGWGPNYISKGSLVYTAENAGWDLRNTRKIFGLEKRAKFIEMTLRSFLLVICFMCGDFEVSHAS
jgi:hypothetical protein